MQSRTFVTDGGLETDLIFHYGVDLPYFAAFPLVNDAEGRALLERYYDGYAAIAGKANAGLMLESPTWRASPDWAARLGYSADELAQTTEASIAQLVQLRRRYGIADCVISGAIGPRGDGYRAEIRQSPDQAAEYHAVQIKAMGDADLVTAYTLNYTAEAIGIVRAARAQGMPVAELDEAEALDEGDPAQLARDHKALEALLPNLSIIGGCCGTDARHVAALWSV